MTDTIQMPRQKTAPWEDIAVFGIGAWLFVSPPTLDLNSSPVDLLGSVITGVLTFILAAVCMRKERLWAELTLIAWGVALAATPWILGYTIKAGIINMVACGVIVIALATLRVVEIRTHRNDTPNPVEAPSATTTDDKPPHDIRRAA